MYFDEKFVAALAAQIATRIIAQIEQRLAKGRSPARLLNVKQAAAYCGRTASSMEHLIFNKEIPVVRIGRRVHLDRQELDRWIEKNAV